VSRAMANGTFTITIAFIGVTASIGGLLQTPLRSACRGNHGRPDLWLWGLYGRGLSQASWGSI